MNVFQKLSSSMNGNSTLGGRRRGKWIAGVALVFLATFAATLPLFGIEITVTVQSEQKNAVKNPLGVGFGHWEGVEPLTITMEAPEGKRITKAEVFAKEDVIWWAADPKAPATFETAAIFPDEAFAVLFKGELANDPVGGAGGGGKKVGGKAPAEEAPKPPEWAVGVNDVDLDFDSDNNAAGPGRHPDESAREDQLEFAEDGPAAGSFGMRLAKEEGWVRLRLKGHATTDGFLSLQATNVTDFEFRDAQQNSLSGLAGATSTGVDGATVLFEKEIKAGTPIEPLAFDVRVTDAGAANKVPSKNVCLVVGQFQAKKPADGSAAAHAIDKGLIKVAPDIDFDFTGEMLLDPEADESSRRHFMYPCVALCNGKMFLRYKTGSADVKSVTFTIKDKNDKVVWEHTDEASADWKEIFPEFRANTKDSKDFSEKPYQFGEKWKYLDPGKNGEVDEGDPDHGNYSPQSSVYKAEMTVRFGEGVAEKKLTLDFAAKSRSVLITRDTDKIFGAYGQGAAIASWQEPGRTPKFSGRVGDSGGWLKLKYESDSFRCAFAALTPRGRLLTINHGASLESSDKKDDDPPVRRARQLWGGLYGGRCPPLGSCVWRIQREI